MNNPEQAQPGDTGEVEKRDQYINAAEQFYTTQISALQRKIKQLEEQLTDVETKYERACKSLDMAVDTIKNRNEEIASLKSQLSSLA